LHEFLHHLERLYKENERQPLFNNNLKNTEMCKNNAKSLRAVKRLESSQPRSELARASLTSQEPKLTKSNFMMQERKKETQKKQRSNAGCPSVLEVHFGIYP
jgi:hypothetical protein